MMTTILFSCLLLATTSSARHIAKRSDDTDPLTAVVQSLSARVAQLEAQQNSDHAMLATKDRHVAFLVQFANVGTLPGSSPYKFDHIVFNDGQGYSTSTGIFTAPFTGVYIFNVQFFTNGNHNGRPLFDMKINGSTIARIGFDADGHTSTGENSDSTSITVRVNAGDKVWVGASGSDTYTLHNIYHTFFSGALLYSA